LRSQTGKAAFEKILGEARVVTRIRITAYCLMPNCRHLLYGRGARGTLGGASRITKLVLLVAFQRCPYESVLIQPESKAIQKTALPSAWIKANTS